MHIKSLRMFLTTPADSPQARRGQVSIAQAVMSRGSNERI